MANRHEPAVLDFEELGVLIKNAVITGVQHAVTALANNQQNVSTFNSAEASKLIPEFNPVSAPHQTIDMWLKKVEDTATTYGWNERIMINTAIPKLKGPAKLWYEGLTDTALSWDEWKDELTTWFPATKNIQRLYREMESRIRKPSENIEVYFHDKLAKARLCGLTDIAAIEFLITGLHDDSLITALSARTFTSPQKLLQSIKQMEERLQLSHSLADNRKLQDSQQQPSAKQSNTTASSQGVSPAKYFTKRKPLRNDKGEFLCFNCSEYGHFAKDCSKPRKKPKCAKCDQFGHKAEDCKTPPAGASSNNQNSMQPQLHLDTLHQNDTNAKYFKDALINGQYTKAYIDLGSKCLTLRKSNADEMGLPYKEDPSGSTIYGYGAGITVPVGFLSAKVQVDQARADVDIYVVPDSAQTIPLLVGQPFTEKSHVTVVRRNNTLRLFEENHNDEDECLRNIKIPDLPKEPVNLWVKEAAVVPVSYIGFVHVMTKDTNVVPLSNIFIDFHARHNPSKEICIPRSIATLDKDSEAIIPVINMSDRELVINAGERLVRAEYCEELRLSNAAETILHVHEGHQEPIPEDKVNIGPDVSPNEKKLLLEILNEYRDCFSDNLKDIGRTDKATMHIELDSLKPVTFRPYRLSFSEREKVKTTINELLDADVITASKSPYASPILIVKKKTGDERLCIDYRELNKLTKRDAYPLPRMEDQVERLQGKKYFTSLDLASGYYQIPLDEESQEKSAFVTPDGHFQFKVLPFGLTNGPACFQRMMNNILGDLRYDIAMAYMDDVITPSMTVQEGLRNLISILDVIRDAHLTLKLKKCYFLMSSIDYLGVEVGIDGMKPGNRKIEAVRQFPELKNVHDVRRFLGLASYFRRFIKGFATIAAPLTELLRKDVLWKWSQVEEKAFDTLKTKLTERPLLALYNHEAPTELHTDASQIGLGCILLQRDHQNRLHPVYYASRRTTPEESRYHSYELETLAIVWATDKFRVYLLGKHFTIVTDCNSVRNTLSKKHLVPRIARWCLKLEDFTYEVVHRPGKSMAHVDALSRSPYEDCQETDIVTGLQILHTDVTIEDWLVISQKQDPKLDIIRDVLQKNSHLTTADKKIHEEYTIQYGRLFKKISTEDGKTLLLWIVPANARWQIVKRHHDDIGHFSVDKTLTKIKEKYWFPRMRRYVRRYIASCLECLYHKNPGGRKPGELHSIDKVGTPFDTLHMDHLGPFVKSTRGNTFLIVIVDAFTKFTILKAVRNTGALATGRVLEEIASTFGAPRRLITDQGTAYTSHSFTNLCKQMHINHVKNATATPRGNGQVERYNRTITPAIASLCARPDEKDWDMHLPQVQWGVNNTIHQAIKQTPFSLLFNFRSRNPAGDYVTDAIEDTFDPAIMRQREQALERIRQDQERQRLRYNAKRAKAPNYSVGDMVVVQREPSATGQPHKTNPKYKGPYVISKQLPCDRYIIEDLPETQRNQKFYRNIAPVDKLKHFYLFDDHDALDSNTESDDNENCATNVSDDDFEDAATVIPRRSARLQEKTKPKTEFI